MIRDAVEIGLATAAVVYGCAYAAILVAALAAGVIYDLAREWVQA